MSSAVLVHVNGWQRSFQASMKRRMAAVRSVTEAKLPRRMAWRVMMPKKASTRFSQLPDVGVKCSVTRGLRASQLTTAGVFVGAVVVAHDVQLAARVGLGDLLEELEELAVAVVLVAGVGDLAGGDLQRGEQRGGAVTDVVVGAPCRQTGADRQHRGGAVGRLDLGLLVHAQHHRRLRRVQRCRRHKERRLRAAWSLDDASAAERELNSIARSLARSGPALRPASRRG